MKTDPILLALGKNLSDLRKEKGLTQEQLAERSGLDFTYISGIERGASWPSPKNLVLLANGFGVSIFSILARLEKFEGIQIKLSSSVIENCAFCSREIESETVWAACPFCGQMNVCCHACEEWIEESAENCYRCVNGSYFVEGRH